MSRFITLNGVEFTDGTLPIVRSYTDSIVSIPGMQGWYNGDSASILVNSNGRISRLKDKSGNGNDFVQSDELRKPLLSGVLNGYPTVQFDRAAEEFMSWTGLYPTGATSKSSKIVLVNVVDDIESGISNILSSNSPTSGRHALYMNSSGGFSVQGPDGGPPSITLDGLAGSWVLVIAEYDAENGLIKLTASGQSVESSGVFDVQNNGLYLGAGGSGGTSNVTMSLSELMIISDTVTDKPETLQLIRDYIENKYGISV